MVKLMLANAMLETNTMDPDQRDTGKTGDATNYSLSVEASTGDMLNRLPGGNRRQPSTRGPELDKCRRSPRASAINKFGINGFFEFPSRRLYGVARRRQVRMPGLSQRHCQHDSHPGQQ
jgi:hypothetical protein